MLCELIESDSNWKYCVDVIAITEANTEHF